MKIPHPFAVQHPTARALRRVPASIGVIALAALAACGSSGNEDTTPVSIRTLSSRADLVSA